MIKILHVGPGMFWPFLSIEYLIMRPEHLDTLLKPSENKANLEHFLTYSLSLLSFICRGVCSTTRVARICISFRNGFWRENEKKTLQEDVNQGWQTPVQSLEAAEWEWLTHGCCCWCLVTKLCQSLCKSMDCSPPGSSVHGPNTGVGCHFLLHFFYSL